MLQFIAIAVFSSMLAYVWSIIFIFTPIQLITDEQKIKNILAKLAPRSTIQAETGPEGIIYGRWYVGLVVFTGTAEKPSRSLYILVRKARLATLDERPPTDDTYRQSAVTVSGNRLHTRFAVTSSTRKKTLATETQQAVINHIRMVYRQKTTCVAWIEGVSGSGKSSVARLLAQELGATLCRDYKPWEPAQSLEALITAAKPTAKKPLVILFDEIDRILLDRVPCEFKFAARELDGSKQTWNSYMDAFHDSGHCHVIIVMTSNTPAETISATVCASLLRAGRIDTQIRMNKKLALPEQPWQFAVDL